MYVDGADVPDYEKNFISKWIQEQKEYIEKENDFFVFPKKYCKTFLPSLWEALQTLLLCPVPFIESKEVWMRCINHHATKRRQQQRLLSFLAGALCLERRRGFFMSMCCLISNMM